MSAISASERIFLVFCTRRSTASMRFRTFRPLCPVTDVSARAVFCRRRGAGYNMPKPDTVFINGQSIRHGQIPIRLKRAAMKTIVKKTVTYGLYPLLLAVVLAVIALAIRCDWDYKAVYWKTTVFLLAVLITA